MQRIGRDWENKNICSADYFIFLYCFHHCEDAFLMALHHHFMGRVYEVRSINFHSWNFIDFNSASIFFYQLSTAHLVSLRDFSLHPARWWWWCWSTQKIPRFTPDYVTSSQTHKCRARVIQCLLILFSLRLLLNSSRGGFAGKERIVSTEGALKHQFKGWARASTISRLNQHKICSLSFRQHSFFLGIFHPTTISPSKY